MADTVRIRRLVTALAASVILLMAAFLAIFAVSAAWKRPAPTSLSAVKLGPLVYEEIQSRLLYPNDAVDAHLLEGLPAAARRTAPGQLLFGAFIQVSNTGSVPARAAGRIELRDATNRTYRPLRLPSSNPFAYRVRTVRGTLPRPDSPAAANLAAGGKLLLFRIRRASYDAGPMELVIHPRGGGPAGFMIL